MFPENSNITEQSRGSIEVITGCMFSGKTEELIRRLKRAKIARQKVQIFKPQIDHRYSAKDVTSHDANSIESTPVNHSSNILLLSDNIDVIGIDEAQFFDDRLPDICQILANKGIRVIVAGLDTDFKGNPFGPMPHLLAIAEFVTKIHAICVRCGNLAHYSYRLAENDNLVVLGSAEVYESLCRACFNKALTPSAGSGGH